MTNKKIPYIIVDDENSAIEDLKDELNLMDIDGVSFMCTASFISPSGLRKYVKDIDLSKYFLFLDYEMPGCNGVELASLLEDKAPNVIFISGKRPSPEEIFDCNAIDFVSKPVRGSRLKKALLKALKNIDFVKPKTLVCFNTLNYHKAEFKIDEIVLIEAHGKTQTLYFEDQKPVELRCSSLKFIADELKGTSCIQVNKQHIVNTSKVTRMQTKDSILVAVSDDNLKIQEKEPSLGDAFIDDFYKMKPEFNR